MWNSASQANLIEAADDFAADVVHGAAVHVTSNDTSWVTPRLSLTVPAPEAVTLFRFSVLVMVAGTNPTQLNEEPSGQTAWNCTLAVGSASSVSGASKSRVL